MSVVAAEGAVSVGQPVRLLIADRAEVVAAAAAEVALEAGNGRLDGDAVTRFQVLHGRADGHHRGGGLVAEDVGSGEDEVGDGGGLPQVNVGAADAGAVRLEQAF